MTVERFPDASEHQALVGHRDQFAPAHYQHPQRGYGYGSAVEDEESSLDLLKILWLIVHHRWLIGAMFVLGVVLGLLFTWVQTPLFRATTKLEVVTNSAKVVQDLEVVSQSADLRVFETAREKLLSRDLARRVVYEQNLSESTEFLTPIASFSLLNVINKATGISASDALEGESAEEKESLAIKAVQDNLTANLVRNTSVLDVGFSHPDPKISADIANQVAKSFLDQNIDSRSETSDLARQFVQQQVIETKKKLEESEIELVDYARKAGITATGEEASLISLNIVKLNESLSKAIADRLYAERFAIQVKEGNLEALPQVSESESIRETRKQIIELKAKYQEKRATLKPGFPEMRSLQAQINEFTSQYTREVAGVGRTLEIAYKQSQETEKSLRAELDELKQNQAKYQEKNINYTILKREVDSNRSQYDSLIGKLNEVRVGSLLKTANINVIDQATIPRVPYSPRLVLNLSVSVILFLGLAAFIILLLELLNNTFATPDQVESDLGLPMLGIIPFVPEDRITDELADSSSQISESYRTLRTSLQFTGAEDEIKTLLITSSEPAEGKSSTIFKLALEFAALGKRVLVIDADMRKPKMHRLFKTDNSNGLSNLLTNVVRSEISRDVFRTTSVPNITFLAAGTIPPNSADLLASHKMSLLLSLCRKQYDLVLVDSSPVMGLSDAPILSRSVDAVLLMVSSKQVHRSASKEAVRRLRSASANIIGAAMSKFSITKTDYNYAYRYMSYNFLSHETENPQTETKGVHDKLAQASGSVGTAFSWIGRFARRFG